MIITEKELADGLHQAFNVHGTGFDALARRAAELLGVTLADGPLASGFYRHEDGQVVHLRDDSIPYNIEAHVESDWALRNRDALTPARIISEEEYTNLLAEVASLQESLDDAQARRADVEAERDELIARVNRLVSIRADEDANPGDAQYAPATLPLVTNEELQEAWDSDDTGADWDAIQLSARQRFKARVQYVLAKRGGARELPGRDEMRMALKASLDRTVFCLSENTVDAATDAVMALYEGGGDE